VISRLAHFRSLTSWGAGMRACHRSIDGKFVNENQALDRHLHSRLKEEKTDGAK
jgi:hypothetical protein